MNQKHLLPFLALFVLVLVPFAHAVATPAQLLIVTQPTTVTATQNVNVTFTVTQPLNMFETVVAQLIVNQVNKANTTFTNISTVNTYNGSVLFTEDYWNETDTVKISFLVTDNGNSTHAANTSVTNTTNSTQWTIVQSTTSLISRDTLAGLPSAGTQLGGFFSGISPGLFAFLLFSALAGCIGLLFVVVKEKVSGGIGGSGKMYKK